MAIENDPDGMDSAQIPAVGTNDETQQAVIANLKSTVESLLQSEERYRTLLALVPDVVYSLDENGFFVYLSSAIQSLGYESSSLIGKHFSVIIHPDDLELCSRTVVLPRYKGMVTGDENAPRLFDERRTGRRMTRNLRIRILREHSSLSSGSRGRSDYIQGSYIYAEITATGHYNADVELEKKVFLGTVGVIRDVTEQKFAEQERLRLEEELRQAQKMEAIGRLAGGLAHDFNNMLGAISGYAELIRKKFAGDMPKLMKYADTILSAARRMAEMTSKLLVFARVGKFEMIEIDFHRLVQELHVSLGRTIPSNIRISMQYTASPSLILGDYSMLQSAIVNIVLNARDAMPKGGHIRCSTRLITLDETYIERQPYFLKPGRYILLTVDDTGVGMDKNTQAHIFEPFFTTKDTGKGIGMGLASAYGTIKAHNGYINVYSELGRGTSVKVYLPVSPTAELAIQPASVEEQMTSNGHILIIDDEPFILSVAQQMLSAVGYSVTTCSSGAKAIAVYEELHAQIDLVIIDMHMAECSGRECFVALRKINPNIKAILSSGYSQNSDIQELVDEGFIEFIQKPFTLGTLSQVVGKALAIKGGFLPRRET